MNPHYCKTLGKIISRHKTVLSNMTYLSFLQLFLLLAPLITFPYLVRVLGKDLYGAVLTAQMLSNYAAVFIDFGTNNVCAKHVSIHRGDTNKLSEIISSVLISRLFMWTIVLGAYITIVILIPSFRVHTLLFILSYGMTFNELLFPQFFYQGIEKMRYITIISIITKLVFILLIFIIVQNKNDYLWVPILYTIGYLCGGIYSLYIILKQEGCRFYVPALRTMTYYIKDSFPIFASDVICTIKDRINYLLVGIFAGMANVVFFDLGLKFNSILAKPTNIISVALFPRFAKNRNIKKIKTVLLVSFLLTVVLVFVVNLFMDAIVSLALGENEIDVLPVRLFTLAPIFLSISVIIYHDFFLAFGHNKYALISILVTTTCYIILLLIMLFTKNLNTIYSFIVLSLCSYFTELLYRAFIYLKLEKKYVFS